MKRARTTVDRMSLGERLGLLRRLSDPWTADQATEVAARISPEFLRRLLLQYLRTTTTSVGAAQLTHWIDPVIRDPLHSTRGACGLPAVTARKISRARFTPAFAMSSPPPAVAASRAADSPRRAALLAGGLLCWPEGCFAGRRAASPQRAASLAVGLLGWLAR